MYKTTPFGTSRLLHSMLDMSLSTVYDIFVRAAVATALVRNVFFYGMET